MLTTDVSQKDSIFIPVSHVNDINLDISIERVDELHVHQDRQEDSWNKNFNVKDVVIAHIPEAVAYPDGGEEQLRNESNDGMRGEVAIPDINEGNLPFDSSVSLVCA